MSNMKRLIFILFLLMLMTALTYSQTPINLDGPGSLSLLNSLTKSPLNQTNGTLNQTNGTLNQTNGTLNQTNGTLNQTNGTLNQTNGTLNTTNQTANLNGNKGTSSSDFWSWGTRPKNYSGPGPNSAGNSANDPLTETSDLKDLNDLSEQNSFATA